MHKVDDGKTGPWNRKHHKATPLGALVLDNRCGECAGLIEGLLSIEGVTTFTEPVPVYRAEKILQVVGPGYVAVSEKRGATFVRKPGEVKPSTP